MNFREQIELSAKDNASSVIRGVMENLRGLIGQMAALAGVGGIGAAFGAAVKEGIGFQKMLEDSRISIAGVVGALHTYRDANGAALAGEEKWRAALSDSAAVQEKLRTAALTTTATYQEMVEAFTTGVGPMSRAGIALDDTAEATQRLTQVAAAASLPMAQLAIEMRQFFAGDEMRSRLLQTLQITKEQIEEHKKAGDMMEFLREKTESYARAAQAATTSMTGQWSNLKDAIQQTLGIGMEPLFAKAKDAIGAISDQFVSFGQDSKGNLTAQFSPEIVARVEGIAETLGKALDRFKEMVPAVIDFGLALAQHVSTGIDLLSKLPLKQIVETLSDIIKLTDGWGLALLGVIKISGGMGAMQTAFAKFPAYLHASSLALDGMALRINAATGASIGLSQAMAGIGAGLAAGGALWGIQKILEGLRIASKLLEEWKLANTAVRGEGKAIEAQLLRFQSAFDARIGPETMAQRGTREAIAGTLAIVRKELTETGKVSDETRGLYLGLLKDIKATNPDFEDSPITRSVANMSAEVVEAQKKWEEFAGKVNDKAILSSLDGMEKKFQETKNAIRDATAEAKTLASAAGLDPSATIKKLTETAWRDFAKAFKAVPAEIVGTWDAELKKLPDTVRTYAAIARDEVDGMFFEEDSVGAAMKAGWLSITAALPEAAESAAQAMRDVWDSAGRAFNDVFYNVITGRLDDLGDVFRGFADSMASTFSNLVTAMIQRWVAGTQTIGDGMRSLNKSMTSEGGGLSWQGGAMAAGTGYGIGSMIGPGGTGNQVGGAVGALAGASLGTKLGTMGGPIGMLVGAILGAVIGGIFNKNSERSVTGSLGGMVGATSWENRPIYARGGREPFGVGDEYDPGEPIGYEWVGTLQKPSTSFEREGQRVFQGQAATLADIFRTGAEDQAGELLAAYQKALKDSLSGAWFKIAAGSEEDIQKDAEILMTRLLPRIGLSAAFGQTGYLPHGDRDAAGGIPGINWGMPGMDESGAWTGAKQLFDPEAPIPKMLAGLGFTEAKISELAGRISTDDPEKLLAYIQGIVGIVVEVNRLTGEMGKSFEELAATWDAEAAAGPAAAFGKQAQEIADAFDALDLYSGDEQIAKAQEAIGLSDQFWQSVEAYLRQLQASVEKMSASLQSQRQKMRDFLSPLGADEGAENAWGEVSGVWGKLRNAVDPGDVEKAVADAQAAIDKVFQVMAERINRGKALLERFGALTRPTGDTTEQTDPLSAWANTAGEIARKVAEASTQSGLAQIQTLEEVGASAEQMYQNLKGFLTDIANVSASINKSIDSQIWELGVGEMDEKGQAGAITARIKELQDQLALATSPAEIQAITSEIQSLTNRYIGTFGKDDQNRDDAIAWAQEQLERARGLAQQQLDALKAQADALWDSLESSITTATDLLSDNVTGAATTIGQLSHTLGELDRVMRETMENLGDGILDSLEPLRVAMDGAADIFKNATDTATNALTEPEVGLADAADRSSSRLDAFSSALDRAIQRIDRMGNGSGKAPSTENYTESASAPRSSRSTAAATVAASRRYAGQLVPRVAPRSA